MARTAPVPNIPAIPGMNPGVFVMGGGGGGGGSGGPGGGAGAGRQGAGGGSGGNQAQGGGKGAPDPQRYPLCGTKSHPVDVATGRAFTHPILIVELPGPLPLQLTRSYSAHAHGRNVGLGWGWAHSLGWRVEEHRRSVDVWTDQGTRVSFPKSLRAGDDVVSSFGFRLRREPWGYVVDPNDGRLYAFSEKLGEHLYLLTAIEDRNKNRIALVYENGQLVEVTDSAGRKLRVRRDGAGHIASFEVKNALEQGRWIALERYNYDARGRLVGATDADGFSARYEYDNEARLTADVDRAGLCFHFVYDAQGRCIESWGDYLSSPDPSLDPDVPSVLASDRYPARGVHHCVFEYLDEDYTHVIDSTHVGHFAHNALGLLTMAHDAGRSPVRAEYDARGFLAVLEHPDGGFERFERDGRGNLLGYTNQLGARTSIVRDEAGSPVEITDPVGGVTHIFRDADEHGLPFAQPGAALAAGHHDPRRRGPPLPRAGAGALGLPHVQGDARRTGVQVRAAGAARVRESCHLLDRPPSERSAPPATLRPPPVMSSSSQRTFVILDERGAAARLPSQIASLVQGHRIIHLSDTRHAPYGTLSRVSAARLVLLCLDLVRGYGISAVLLASAAASRAALPVVRIGCARAGIALHEGASLAAREVVRRHRFGDVAVLGGEIVDERAVAEALAEAGLSARTRAVPLDLASLGEGGKDALGRLVEAQRAQVGTYVLGSSEAARVADLIRRSDPDAVIVEADAALAAEVAVALEAEPAAGKTASTVIRCATEASEHWQERIAELAGVAPDAVAGRWVMPAGPSEGPFAVAMDEDGDPLD